MSEGQQAAEGTKDVFREIGNAGESIRQNVNSFADNLLGDNKEHSSTGIHPDAQKTGEAVQQGASDASSKVSESVSQTKKANS